MGVIGYKETKISGLSGVVKSARDVSYVLTGNSEWRRLLERPKRRWADSIKMDVKLTVF
jgi:hypothetical protein